MQHYNTSATLTSSRPTSQAVQTLRLQHLARHVHRLGERSVFALLTAISERVGHDAVLAEAEEFARLTPDMVRAARAERMSIPPLDIIPGSRR